MWNELKLYVIHTLKKIIKRIEKEEEEEKEEDKKKQEQVVLWMFWILCSYVFDIISLVWQSFRKIVVVICAYCQNQISKHKNLNE